MYEKMTEDSYDDEITENTERIDPVKAGGRFEMLLEVKIINTSKAISDE